MQIIIICVAAVSLLVGVAIGFIIIEHEKKKDFKPDFIKNKQNVVQGLQLKKDALEKEMTDEARQNTEALLQRLENKQAETTLAIIKEENRYLERKKQLDEQLAKNHDSILATYAEMDKKAYADLQEKHRIAIQELESNYSKEIDDINKHYGDMKEEIQENFLAFSADISMRKEKMTKEIEEYEAQQQTIIERFKKDDEARQQADFYHISIDAPAQRDVAQLRTLALNFSKPEILYKLLYEVYYKTKMEELFKRVLGNNKDKGGIYKITNIKNQKVYIGKTTKFIDRWRTHAKRGCGIERIKGQLYDAMFEDGLENYTWEIVEVCDKDKQASLEKYWILFYKSDQWGYNMKIG